MLVSFQKLETTVDYATGRPAMPRMPRLPEEVARLFAPLKPHFRHRHYLVLCWLVVAHLMCFEKATLQALAHHSSTRVAAWHLRRLLAAGCWPGWWSRRWAHFLRPATESCTWSPIARSRANARKKIPGPSPGGSM